MFPRPDFFAGAQLNFAENLLFPPNVSIDESSTAVVTVAEDDSRAVSTSWLELREAVRSCSSALRAAGVKEQDVVAGFISNHVEAVVAMLASASLGAVWTSISPDNGVTAVLDRLVQIKPRVLFADNGMVYNGKEWPSKAKSLQIVKELKKHGLELVIVVENLQSQDLGLEELKGEGLAAEEYQGFLHR